MNVPTKGLVDKRYTSTSRSSLQPNTTKALLTTGRKNPNMGASIRGRQHGGGFPTTQA